MFTKLEAENALSQARAEAERRVTGPSLPLFTNFSRSYTAYEEARKHLPSGASSNIRVHAHDPFPILFRNGLGSGFATWMRTSTWTSSSPMER